MLRLGKGELVIQPDQQKRWFGTLRTPCGRPCRATAFINLQGYRIYKYVMNAVGVQYQ